MNLSLDGDEALELYELLAWHTGDNAKDGGDSELALNLRVKLKRLITDALTSAAEARVAEKAGAWLEKQRELIEGDLRVKRAEKPAVKRPR